jgi:hypothetical protein
LTQARHANDKPRGSAGWQEDKTARSRQRRRLIALESWLTNGAGGALLPVVGLAGRAGAQRDRLGGAANIGEEENENVNER